MALLEGSTVVITGATNGIGLSAAIALAKEKPRLVVVGRDAGRAAAAVETIKRASGNGQVEALLADFASLDQVRRLAGEIQSKCDRLHVLVNNAGLFSPRREETLDGYEKTFAVDHLAPFLLTELLRGLLVKSAPARIVTTASAAHSGGELVLDDLQRTRRPYKMYAVYGDAKLANILFTRELARRLDGTQVTANCFHPGVVGSNIGTSMGSFLSFAMVLAKPFLRSPEKGAQTAVYLATSPDVAQVSGKYFIDEREAKTSAAGQDMDLARRLWEASEALVAAQQAAKVA